MRRMFPLMEGEASGEGAGAGGGGESRDFVGEAAKMGWVPEEKWHGKGAWIDAETFVKRGEEVLPIVLSENKKLKDQILTLQQANQQSAAEAAEFRQYMETARARDKADLDAALREAQDLRKQAVKDGDGEAFEAAEERIEKLRKAAAPAGGGTPQNGGPVHPDWAPWVAQNQWYTADEEMRVDANALAIAIAKKEGLNGKALYDKVTAKMQKLYPDKFETIPARGGAPEGEGEPTSKPTGNGRKAKTYDNLPPDAKLACDRYIKKGWIVGKTQAEARAKYCADYQWD